MRFFVFFLDDVCFDAAWPSHSAAPAPAAVRHEQRSGAEYQSPPQRHRCESFLFLFLSFFFFFFLEAWKRELRDCRQHDS